MSIQQTTLLFFVLLPLFSFVKEFTLNNKKNWYTLIYSFLLSAAYFFNADFKIVILLSLLAIVASLEKRGKVKKYLTEWLPWAFLFLAYIYRAEQDFRNIFVMTFVVLKSFVWPINFYENNEEMSEKTIYSEFFTQILIWSSIMTTTPSYLWSFIWIGVAIFFSLGSCLSTTFLAVALSLVSLDQENVLLCFPLALSFLSKKQTNYIFLVFMLVSGVLIFKNNELLSNISFVLPAALGLFLARNLVAEVKKEEKMHKQEQMASATFFSLPFFAFIFFKADVFLELTPEAITFMGVLMVFFGVFLFLYNKKPAIFKKPAKFLFFSWLFKKIIATEKYMLTRHEELKLKDWTFFERLMALTKGNAVILILFTLLALSLFWGEF
ncbi:MAG: hypothetical protein IPM57_04365 [Oligoflexia bacterium]|nr:hypothetical protein [Oligoflexia bacterium]